ncbi:class I SAM-dependent methyltransferase [Enterococcus faecium]|nr:class I SAM-dependent methyltransferase [Enterococcus faecium]
MNEKEWDEFAEEYYEIQQESQVTIAEDVKNYLKTEKVLPAETAADVAGGSGRFLSLAKEINRYDLIDFSSGMLENAKKEAEKNELPNVSFIKQSLEEFIQSNETYEMVFTAANPALVHLIQLEKLMKKSSKWCVIIRVVESITEELMKLYYDAYAKDPVVTRYIRKLFSEKREILSTTKLTYRLLLWSADKKRTFHDS